MKPGSVTKELYDLQADPTEGRNLLISNYEKHWKLAQELEQKMDSWIQNCLAAHADL